MTYDATAWTDVGPVRETNEDEVYLSEGPDWYLLAVADGMGGHVGGEIASDAAIEAFSRHVESHLSAKDSEVAVNLLENGVHTANDRLRALVEEDPSLEGMGTTMVAALVQDGMAQIVNVGDSRAYHVTNDTVDQVTVDQSLVNELLEEGAISEVEADDHPHSNVVSQALGTDESVVPDRYAVDLEGTLLLCSDGLSDVLTETEIQEVLETESAIDSVGRKFIKRAKSNGADDNISLVILQ